MWPESSSVEAVNLVEKICNWDNEFFGVQDVPIKNPLGKNFS